MTDRSTEKKMCPVCFNVPWGNCEHTSVRFGDDPTPTPPKKRGGLQAPSSTEGSDAPCTCRCGDDEPYSGCPICEGTGTVRLATSTPERSPVMPCYVPANPVSKHLWEVDHPYYCNEGNYYANDCGDSYKRWADFYENYKDADFDMNLLFRWDWKEEDAESGEPNFTGDVNYRNGKLLIFWMGQRKGLYRWSEVEVCRADEPAVIEFLKPRLARLMKLWEPLV